MGPPKRKNRLTCWDHFTPMPRVEGVKAANSNYCKTRINNCCYCNTTTRDKGMRSTGINNCNQMSTIDKSHTSDEIIRLFHLPRIQSKHLTRYLLWFGTLSTQMTRFTTIETSNIPLAFISLVTLLTMKVF